MRIEKIISGWEPMAAACSGSSPRRIAAYTAQDGLPSDSVRGITDDGAGGLWIGTYQGLVHLLTKPEAKLTTYDLKDGLPDNMLFALHRDRSQSLWIGSRMGLIQFKDGKFTTFAAAPGLVNLSVHSIAEDREGICGSALKAACIAFAMSVSPSTAKPTG